MPQIKTTMRRDSGPTAVPKVHIQQRAQVDTQPVANQRTNTQQTSAPKPSSGPSMPVPKPHIHPYLDLNTKHTHKIRKLRQPYPKPQAAASELYYYVHEADGTHTWRTERQLKTMSEEGSRGTWCNDQDSGFMFFWRTR